MKWILDENKLKHGWVFQLQSDEWVFSVPTRAIGQIVCAALNTQPSAAEPSELAGKVATLKSGISGTVIDYHPASVIIQNDDGRFMPLVQDCEFSDPPKPEHRIIMQENGADTLYKFTCSCGWEHGANEWWSEDYAHAGVEAWRQHANEAEVAESATEMKSKRRG